MLKQLDDERNVVIVLNAAEAASFQTILAGTTVSGQLGLIPMTTFDRDLTYELIGATYLLSDEELIDGAVAPHLEHPGDDIAQLREQFTKIIPASREVAVDNGWTAAA